MNMKDKTNRITLRLNDKQFGFIKNSADVLGVSPSEFLRMVVNSTMVISDTKNSGDKGVFNNVRRRDVGRANDESNIDN